MSQTEQQLIERVRQAMTCHPVRLGDRLGLVAKAFADVGVSLDVPYGPASVPVVNQAVPDHVAKLPCNCICHAQPQPAPADKLETDLKFKEYRQWIEEQVRWLIAEFRKHGDASDIQPPAAPLASTGLRERIAAGAATAAKEFIDYLDDEAEINTDQLFQAVYQAALAAAGKPHE